MELWLDYSNKYKINNLNYIVLVKTAKISNVFCIICKVEKIEEGQSGRNGIPWNSLVLICNLKFKSKINVFNMRTYWKQFSLGGLCKQ